MTSAGAFAPEHDALGKAVERYRRALNEEAMTLRSRLRAGLDYQRGFDLAAHWAGEGSPEEAPDAPDDDGSDENARGEQEVPSVPREITDRGAVASVALGLFENTRNEKHPPSDPKRDPEHEGRHDVEQGSGNRSHGSSKDA